MNKTMADISTAVSAAIEFRTPGVEFHRTLSSRYGYIVERDAAGIVDVFYRGTRVARVHLDGSVTIRNGGYETPTTKNVINAALAGAGVHASVYQRAYAWRIGTFGGAFEHVARRFESGMTVRTVETPQGPDVAYEYPHDPHRCRYDFGIIDVWHGRVNEEGGMCETCRAN